MSDKDQPGPIALRLLIGHLLRGHRERCGMSLQQADAHLQVYGAAPNTATELEQGAVKQVNLIHLIHLCEAYGVQDLQERARLLKLGRYANGGVWWNGWNSILASSEYLYLGLEQQAADHIHAFCPHFLPGLLQTPDYARTILARTHPDPVDAEHRLALLLQRQKRLDTGSLSMTVLITETALHVGDRRLAFRQLEHLQDLCDHPRLTLHLLPAAAHPHPFDLICLPPVLLPEPSQSGSLRVVYLPHDGVTAVPLPDAQLLLLSDLVHLPASGSRYLHHPNEVRPYHDLLARLTSQTPRAEHTPRLLRDLARQL